MNNDIKNMRATLLTAKLRRNFTEWLRADADRLITAAEFVGGAEWQDRAISVSDAIARGAEPEEIYADLTALHRLLTLDCGSEINSLEGRYSLAIPSDDARAADAQLCAEAMERGLQAMRRYAASTAKEKT
ncbi:hypothetical protein [Hyphomonas sp.]|uniref:hypothetical protein n=1 Tax=Hyphomonas sp. TaxID=87 RepID=UPI00326326FD